VTGATVRMTPRSTTSPRLAELLCFAIYGANLAYGRAYKAALAKLGLTYTQYIAILALGENEGQTVSELGDRLFLESSTLTPTLKRLEAMGYVRRRRDTSDERQVLLSLTDAGRGLHARGLGIDPIALSGLTATEFRQLHKRMSALRDTLHESVL